MKGTTRGNHTPSRSSNTPLRAEPTAKTRKKVDAVERSIRKTAAKGGKVQGAATIGRNKLNIDGGHKDYFGSKHAARHFGPNSTNPRKAARAIVHGEGERSKQELRKTHKKTASIMKKEKRRELKYITSYKDKN